MAKKGKFNIANVQDVPFEESTNTTDANDAPPTPTEDAVTDAPEMESELKDVIGTMGGNDAVPETEYNPLAGNVPPRGEHAKIKVDPSIKKPIPDFVPPSADMFSSEAETKEPLNPGLGTQAAGDKAQAAESMADFIITVWRFLKELAAKGVQIPTQKLIDLHKANKIDMHYPVPVGDGQFITFTQAIEQFNLQIQQPFAVSEDFIAQVKPPMIREFTKRGIGFTDAQLLMSLWGFEIMRGTVSFIGGRAYRNELLNNEIENHARRTKGARPNVAPPPPPPAQAAPEVNVAAAPAPAPEAPPATPKEEYKEPEEVAGSEKLEVGG